MNIKIISKEKDKESNGNDQWNSFEAHYGDKDVD